MTGIAAAILVVIFGSQRYGTTFISSLFAPVVIVWLALNAGIGIRNLSLYGGTIFKAINPAEVVWFFQRNGERGWRMLGGVVLCITGAEAMYADMGHFTRQAISVRSKRDIVAKKGFGQHQGHWCGNKFILLMQAALHKWYGAGSR